MTYTPAAGYSGTDTFQYSVDDSADDRSNTYTVNMTVTPDFTSLNSAIISAQTDAGSVTISADGTDVLPANMWVTSAELAAYNDAITAAQEVANDTSATQVQIDSAITTLAAATSTFDSEKQAGTKSVDFTSLNSAIISAQTDAGSVTVSADGTDVLPANMWITSTALAAYNGAITAAQAVASDTSATQVQIDSAITTLAAATSTFDSAKQAGTKPPDLTSLNSAIISAQTDAGSVTVSADGTDVLPANMWVTSAEFAAYNDAITAAQEVANDTSATQVQIDSAITTLAAAT
jgi:archaellum component FlaF (FlaF/FlaG flagellin family)